jgi:hypothetical protein
MQALTTQQLVKSIGRESAVTVRIWLNTQLDEYKNLLVLTTDIVKDQGKALALKKLVDDLDALLQSI